MKSTVDGLHSRIGYAVEMQLTDQHHLLCISSSQDIRHNTQYGRMLTTVSMVV